MRPPPGAADRPFRAWATASDPMPTSAPALKPPRPELGSGTAPAPKQAPKQTTQDRTATRTAPAPQSGTRAGTQTGETVTANASTGTMPRPDTQYHDADLTIGDVIDADADMAEQIGEGADQARRAAEGADRLITKLEALHAKIIELKVPGALEGLVLLLMDKTGEVKARAEAIADKLPAASEAIAVAGTNAETRHKPLADAVRDAGHIRPAEREYHNG